MINSYKYKAFAVAMGMLSLTACDQDKDVEPIMDPSSKPVITVTRVGDNAAATTIEEGDILEFEVKTSKWMRTATDFVVESENLMEGVDYEILTPASIAAFSSTAVLQIEVLSDNFPENDEEFDLRVVSRDIAQTWKLNPESIEGSLFNIGVKNINAAGAISVGFLWADDHDDFDFYVYRDGDEGFWGVDAATRNMAATGNWPETSRALRADDPDGTYYVLVDPYAVEHDVVDYTISVGKEDGSSEVFDGTLDLNSEELPTVEGMISLIKIVKTGSDITVTHLN